MSPRKSRKVLTRALVAVAGPALALSLAAAPAQAAAVPDVPSVEQAGAVYAHLVDGTVSETPINKIKGYSGKKCKADRVFRGARGNSGYYMSADPTTQATGATPSVTATAYRFRNAKDAKAFLHPKLPKKCHATGGHNPGQPGSGSGCKGKVQKIRFKLGDERSGIQVRCGSMVMQHLTVRDGKHVVFTSAMSTDGTVPSVKKAVEFVKVALKAAR